MGSTLADLLKALMEQGFRHMTVVDYRHRGIFIEHGISGIENDSPDHMAFEQADGTVTIYRKDPNHHIYTFVTSVMR